MTVEEWRMPSGRIARINLRQPAAAVEDARALLRDHGGAVPLNEESPAGQGEGFENTPTPSKEKMMNNNQTTTVPEYAAIDVAETLAEIDASPSGMIHLEPSDALYQEILPVRIKPAVELGGYEIGEVVSLGLPIDADGCKLGDDFWAALERVPEQDRRWWKSTPNVAMRVGDALVISLGVYVVAAERDVDDVLTVELVTFDERNRRQRAERAAYVAAHPEISAAQPEWASETAVDEFDEDGADVIYSRDFGPVSLSRSARFENGRVRFDDDTSAPATWLHEWEDLTLEKMRALAAGLLAAIPTVEAALDGAEQ